MSTRISLALRIARGPPAPPTQQFLLQTCLASDSSIRSSLRIPEIGPHFSRINTELSHAVAQCASFHTQSGRCSIGTTHSPFGLLENVHNFLLLFEITDNFRRIYRAVRLVR